MGEKTCLQSVTLAKNYHLDRSHLKDDVAERSIHDTEQDISDKR